MGVVESMSPMAVDYYSSSRSTGASTATTESGGAAQLPAAAEPGNAVVDVSPADETVTSRPAVAAAVQGSSRYKGVVPQPNGRWGAQIYERHARVWLGTFPDEEAAARAYDVAALRYRGREAATNFPGAGASAPELAFLAAHSKAEVVDMLRKHTYADELRQGLRRGRGMGARAAVREGRHAQRRRQAQPPRRAQAARREALPAQAHAGDGHRQGRAPQLRGRRGEGVALPVLVLEQQPELRAHQGLEPLRLGEGPPSRRLHRLLALDVRAGEAAVHRLQEEQDGRRQRCSGAGGETKGTSRRQAVRRRHRRRRVPEERAARRDGI